MSEYRFTKIGKLKKILLNIIIFVVVSIILLFISKLNYLKYVIWIPFLWLLYHIFANLMYYSTTSFKVDNSGLLIICPFDVKEKISWQDIEKICLTKKGEKVTKLTIFKKGVKEPLILENIIENHEALFATILANVDNQKITK